MDSKDFAVVEKYEKEFLTTIKALSVDMFVKSKLYTTSYDRKGFALGPAKKMIPLFTSFIFKMWDNPTQEEASTLILEKIKASVNSNKNFDAVKEQLFPDIEYNFNGVEE